MLSEYKVCILEFWKLTVDTGIIMNVIDIEYWKRYYQKKIEIIYSNMDDTSFTVKSIAG